MILDWPESKREVSEELQRAVRRRAEAEAPIANQIPHFTIKEGRTAVIVQADQSRNEIELGKHSASFQVSREDVLKRGPALLADFVEEVGGALGREKDKVFLELLRRVSKSTGGFYGGTELEELAERFLNTLQQIDFGFDEVGKPTLFGVMSPAAAQLLAEIDAPTSPYYDRLKAVMKEKHDEWLRRESYRKLAD